jgi:hypothetical protein
MSTHLPAVFCAFRILAGLSWFGLLCVGGPTYSADKEPAIKVITTPATANRGPTVRIEGEIGFRYIAYADLADNTTFDLTGLASSAQCLARCARVCTAIAGRLESDESSRRRTGAPLENEER